MERSNLNPFLGNNLDILFCGLNPAKGSSHNRHYFSVNQAFWNQLYCSELITSRVDKSIADELVFGTTTVNHHGWAYGITDLITDIAESHSSNIKPTRRHSEALKSLILELTPKVVILLHQKVVKFFLPFLGYPAPMANVGQLGELIEGCPTMFFGIAFPHGNVIRKEAKAARYHEVKHYLDNFMKWVQVAHVFHSLSCAPSG